jgi:hypothetical protein
MYTSIRGPGKHESTATDIACPWGHNRQSEMNSDRSIDRIATIPHYIYPDRGCQWMGRNDHGSVHDRTMRSINIEWGTCAKNDQQDGGESRSANEEGHFPGVRDREWTGERRER